MITKKQRELLEFINDYISRKGVTPSYDEMKDALGLKSKSGIHSLISGLEERGFLKKIQNKARAIEVIKMPGAGHSRAGFVPSVIEGSLGRVNKEPDKKTLNKNQIEELAHVHPSAILIPMLGSVSASCPLKSVQNHSYNVPVAEELLHKGDHFALLMKGSSMEGMGINDGDMLIFHRQKSVTNSDIVLAIIDDEEAMIKVYRKKGEIIALEAAHASHETRLLQKDRVEIVAKLIMSFRQY